MTRLHEIVRRLYLLIHYFGVYVYNEQEADQLDLCGDGASRSNTVTYTLPVWNHCRYNFCYGSVFGGVLLSCDSLKVNIDSVEMFCARFTLH